MTTPIPCSTGYVAAIGSITCTQCRAGEIALPDSTSCLPCPGGYSCSGGNKIMCFPGFYSPEGSSICYQCSSGRFCPVGATYETVCPTGYYSSVAAYSCTICPAGYYCQNTSNPLPCPTATSSKEGSSTCFVPNSCYDLLNKTGIQRSGVCNITTWMSHTTINVYCDMVTEGGGWTETRYMNVKYTKMRLLHVLMPPPFKVFQRKFDGSVDFYRNFTQYENELGSASGEYWLGLRTIQEMLARTSHAIRIDVEDYDGVCGYDVYSNFTLKGSGYTVYVDNRTRSLNMFRPFQFSAESTDTPYGRNFSTFDHDQDLSNGTYSPNCALYEHGAWWYAYCYSANLNGDYGKRLYTVPPTLQGSGIRLYSFDHDVYLRSTKMMFRPSGGH